MSATASPHLPIRPRSGCWRRRPRARSRPSNRRHSPPKAGSRHCGRTRPRSARRCRRRGPSWRASRPRPARWPGSSMSRAATCFRRWWSRSRSSAAMRPRWARRSARISTCRSTAARRPIGATATSSPAIRNCRKASCRWPNSCRRRPRWRAGLPRSASSSRPTPHGSPGPWRPASGWSAATARCGAGTGWWPAPMRRPPPRNALPRRTASPSSTPKPSPRRKSCAPPSRRWPTPSAVPAKGPKPSGSPARAGVTRSIASTRRAMRWTRPRRPPASCRCGAPRSPNRCRAWAKRIRRRPPPWPRPSVASPRPPTCLSCSRLSTAWRPRSSATAPRLPTRGPAMTG